MKYEHVVYDVMEGNLRQIHWMQRQLVEMTSLKGMSGLETQIQQLVDSMCELSAELYRRKYDAAVAAGIPVDGKRS